MSSHSAAVAQKMHANCGETLVSDGESDRLTDVGADYSDDDCMSLASSQSSFLKERVVRFADETGIGVLQEVVEVESFKEYCRFTVEDRAQAEEDWCEKLLEQVNIVEAGGVARLRSHVVELAVSADGYETVQYAFESARRDEQVLLLTELQGYVNVLATSAYGTEVLQTCLELMRPTDISFIVEELNGDAVAIARTEAGQAVLCRIFEYLPQKCTAPLAEELLMSVRDLCCHPFGSLVISHLIDYSSCPYRLRTCEAITTHALFLSKHRRAVPLLKKAQVSLRKNLK